MICTHLSEQITQNLLWTQKPYDIIRRDQAIITSPLSSGTYPLSRCLLRQEIASTRIGKKVTLWRKTQASLLGAVLRTIRSSNLTCRNGMASILLVLDRMTLSRIHLRINLKRRSWEGRISIILQCKKWTGAIMLQENYLASPPQHSKIAQFRTQNSLLTVKMGHSMGTNLLQVSSINSEIWVQLLLHQLAIRRIECSQWSQVKTNCLELLNDFTRILTSVRKPMCKLNFYH